MRQYVLFDKETLHPAFKGCKPKKFYEDIDDKGCGYGYRNSPGEIGFDCYYRINQNTGKRIIDQQNGNYYYSQDQPTGDPASFYMFKIVVIDTCNKNKVVIERRLAVIWPEE